MKFTYKQLSLRPYTGGNIHLFNDLEMMNKYYTAKTGNECPHKTDKNGGMFVQIEGVNFSDTIWIVYGRKPHVLAHEFTHILFHVFDRIGAEPQSGNGEPFCYMLSQLMLEADGK